MTGLVVWPAWIAGALIGCYLALQYLVTGKALGCSSGYRNVCGLFVRMPGLRSEGEEVGSWRLWFAIGLPLGGIIAALTSGVMPVPSFDMGPLYEGMLPAPGVARALFLIGGGVLIGVGARMAGGCQSGHTINGVSLLNPPSLLASAGFFAGGLVAVQTLSRFAGSR